MYIFRVVDLARKIQAAKPWFHQYLDPAEGTICGGERFRRCFLGTNLQPCISMGVSKNRGTPKSSILIGFSIINHPFWSTIICGNTRMVLYLQPLTVQKFNLNTPEEVTCEPCQASLLETSAFGAPFFGYNDFSSDSALHFFG